MKILLDTVTFVMVIAEPERLSAEARELFADSDNEIFLSVVSGWEILVKYKLGKLFLKEKPEVILTEDALKHGIQIIPLEMRDVLQLSVLPEVKNHKDPFDRMLVCQARAQKMLILTPDPLIGEYDVEVIW